MRGLGLGFTNPIGVIQDRRQVYIFYGVESVVRGNAESLLSR